MVIALPIFVFRGLIEYIKSDNLTVKSPMFLSLLENEQFHSEPKLFYILGEPILFSPPSMDNTLLFIINVYAKIIWRLDELFME